MEKIAVYGGSFDPPHEGHRLLADNLVKYCGADRVIVIPAAMSPFKETSGASANDRLEMCRLAFNDPLYEVSDIEINRGGKSYTIDTLTEIKKSNPNSELYFFVGDDMLLSFDRWYRYNDILKICTLVAACRTEKLEKLREMQAFAEEKLKGGNVLFCQCVPLEISSTQIRDNIKIGDFRCLSPEVSSYIISKELYK